MEHIDFIVVCRLSLKPVKFDPFATCEQRLLVDLESRVVILVVQTREETEHGKDS